MQPQDPKSRPEPVPAGSPEAIAASEGGGRLRGKAPAAHVWLWAAAAGILAGLVSWLGGEAAYGHFQPIVVRPANWSKLSPYEKTDVLADLTRRATPAAESKNTAVAYGLLGALLAGALGLLGGLARRSYRDALVAALFGVATGATVGIGMAMVSTRIFYQHLDPESGMTLALLIHGGIWVPVGAAAGLALGIGLGGTGAIVRALIGGLAGAALGTMLFEVVNAVLFPLVRVLEPVPAERLPRLMAFLGVSVFVALGAALGIRERVAVPSTWAE